MQLHYVKLELWQLIFPSFFSSSSAKLSPFFLIGSQLFCLANTQNSSDLLPQSLMAQVISPGFSGQQALESACDCLCAMWTAAWVHRTFSTLIYFLFSLFRGKQFAPYENWTVADVMLGIRDSHYSFPLPMINHVRFFIHSAHKTPNYLPWHVESSVPQLLSWQEQSMCAIKKEKQTAVDRKDSNRGNTPIWRSTSSKKHIIQDTTVKATVWNHFLSALNRNSKQWELWVAIYDFTADAQLSCRG